MAERQLLAIVQINEDESIDSVHYLRNPFDTEPPWVVEPDVDSIASIINSLLDGEKWALTKDKFVRRYAHRNDGKATKRVVRQIKRIVGP